MFVYYSSWHNSFKLAFEPIEGRKLSDVDGNIVPSFKSLVVKAFRG